MRKALCTAPCLALPRFDLPFELVTDASAIGVGAVLQQDAGVGPQLVAYFSRKLSATERNYNTTDRELLALLLAAKRWRPYLHGKQTRVCTDHEPLVDMRMQPG